MMKKYFLIIFLFVFLFVFSFENISAQNARRSVRNCVKELKDGFYGCGTDLLGQSIDEVQKSLRGDGFQIDNEVRTLVFRESRHCKVVVYFHMVDEFDAVDVEYKPYSGLYEARHIEKVCSVR